jgi:hypothetical protein
MTDKPIPKSLHTIRVVAVLANAMRWNYPGASDLDMAKIALYQLGYTGAPDTYGIAAAAAKQIAKGN